MLKMSFRPEIVLINSRLTGIDQDTNKTKEADKVLKRALTDLEKELMDVNATLARKQELLDKYLTSGFSGIHRQILKKISHFMQLHL